jgi:hypothetical protein
MLPLSDSFIELMVNGIFFAVCALCLMQVERSKLAIIVPIAVFFGYAYWGLSGATGGYEELDVIIQIFGIGALGFVWGGTVLAAISMFKPKRKTGALFFTWELVAILPVCVVIIFGLTQEYNPPTKCSQSSINVRLGGIEYTLPRQFENMVRRKETEGRAQYHYSRLGKHKKYLKALCELTEQGQKAIEVDQVWVKPQGDIGGNPIPKVMVISVEKFKRESYGGTYRDTKNVAEVSLRPGNVGGGNERDGYLCRSQKDDLQSRVSCKIWYMQGDDTIVIGQSGLTSAQNVDDLLKRVRDGTAIIMKQLVP